MRTFPNIWVPPGGSIDWNEESLFTTGLRELKEETNITFADEDVVSCKPLCMWESVYPTMLSKGNRSAINFLLHFYVAIFIQQYLPAKIRRIFLSQFILYLGDAKRQHSVVYFHIMVNKRSEELQSQIVLQEQEVSASAWFDHKLVKIAIGQQNGFIHTKDSSKMLTKDIPKTFTIYSFIPNTGGSCQLIEWPTDVLILRVKDCGSECSDIERLSSGTIFALEQWLCSKAT